MTKKEFLSKLEEELDNLHYEEKNNILEYYEELIEDKKESGKREKEIIKEIGSIENIIKNIEIEKKIDKAATKPTLSNGLKALIAFLGVCSAPVLFIVAVLIFAFFVTFGALLFAFIAVIGALIVSGIVSVIGIFISLCTNTMPVSTFLFVLGILLVSIVLLLELIRWSIGVTKISISWMAAFLKTKLVNRRGGTRNE